MSYGSNEFNNLATRVAVCKSLIEEETCDDDYVDKLLSTKDDIDKAEVMEHLEDFSCKEELDRYVEHKEEKIDNHDK